ncbi:MATE family efflux transporter [Chloroflexota bacterium]
MDGAGGKRAAFRRDWTKGSIIRNLLLLSWPMVINQSLNVMGPTIDLVWVGQLGAISIAGVGVAGMVVMLANTMMMGLVMGVRAMIARFIGAGDIEAANQVARQAFVISATFSTVVVSTGVFFAAPILGLFGLEHEVIVEGATYMRIMLIGSVAMSFRMMGDGIMQSSGDAMNPMKIAVLFRFFHVVLCPFLVFGWWIFPSMGVGGAALSNVISQSLGMVLGLRVLLTGRSRLWLNLSNFHLAPDVLWRVVKIGVPASVMGMGRTLGHLMLMRFMVPFGTLAVAAHTVCQRIDMILIMLGIGLGVGSGVLVGQNLGARQPERAEKSGWLGAGFVEAAMFIGSMIILLGAENIVRVFNAEPGLVELASTFMRIATVGYLMLGFTTVLQFSISGAGDTLPPMLATLVIIWLVQIPLALLLSQHTALNVYGVRWSIAISMIVGAMIYIIYFRLGRWKLKGI